MLESTTTVDLVSPEWRGEDQLRARYVQNTGTLVAIHRSVARSRALAEEHRQFLELVERVQDAGTRIFGRVWTDPGAFFWTRVTQDLLAEKLSGAPRTPLAHAYAEATGAPDPLARSLADFGRFALAVYFLMDRDLELEVPLRGKYPLAIPGTPFSIQGTGEYEVQVLSLRELTRCAEATCDKYTLRLQPEAFALPGAQLATDPEWAGQELQAKHVDVVERALRLISRYASHRFEQLSATMQLIALQPRSLTAVGSSSRSYFPGASVIGLVENPYELAASLIRELFHNRLFFIAEQADLFSVSHPSKVLFREMYMQVPVVEYWLAVAAEHAAGESAHVQAVDRAFGGICALELATRELSSFKGFSDFGAKLYEVMSTNLILFSEQISAYRPSQTPN